MSQKTDSPEFAHGFLWQIILVTMAALCVVIAIHSDLTWRLTKWTGARIGIEPITLYPWVYGGGWTLENALRAFGGKAPQFPPAALRAATLVLVLISMVVCPTFVFLEWRRRRLTKVSSSEHPLLRMSSVFYAFCIVITVIGPLGLGPATYFSERVRTDLRHRQAIQGNRDAMIYDLNVLAVNATQYYILPRPLGGGGRSFEGYSVPEKLARSEDASYGVIGSKNEAAFHATSTKYPSCTINVKIDSVGHMAGWTYEGEFK